VGAFRITKMVKYLLRMGWDITVITARKDLQTSSRNEDLLREVEGARIIRTDADAHSLLPIREHGFLWRKELKKELNRLLQEESFDVSLWTGGPFMHFPVAVWMKKRYHLPYVLDFRDPWAFALDWKGAGIAGEIKRRIACWMERRAVRNAAAMVHVSTPCAELYQSRYPESGVVEIPNGFDPEDYADVKPKSFSRFDIVYPGKFAHLCDPEVFFQAFRSLVESRKLTPADIRFVWIGEKEGFVDDYIRKYALDEYVTRTGFLPYRQALEYISGARLGMLLSSRHTLATKIFDYLALGKKVLLIDTFNNRSYDMLSEVRDVIRVVPEHTAGALEKCYADHGLSSPDDLSIMRYSRAKIAEEMGKVLSEAIEKPQGK